MQKYSDKTVDEICDYLENGLFQKDAAKLAGISETTFYDWLENKRSFRSRVEASLLKYKEKLIKNVNKGTDKEGKLALEVLARRWPDEFGEKIKHEGTIKHEHKLTYDRALEMIDERTKRQPAGQLDEGESRPEGVREVGS